MKKIIKKIITHISHKKSNTIQLDFLPNNIKKKHSPKKSSKTKKVKKQKPNQSHYDDFSKNITTIYKINKFTNLILNDFKIKKLDDISKINQKKYITIDPKLTKIHTSIKSLILLLENLKKNTQTKSNKKTKSHLKKINRSSNTDKQRFTPTPTNKKIKTIEDNHDDITEMSINCHIATILKKNGYNTFKKIASIQDKDLEKINFSLSTTASNPLSSLNIQILKNKFWIEQAKIFCNRNKYPKLRTRKQTTITEIETPKFSTTHQKQLNNILDQKYKLCPKLGIIYQNKPQILNELTNIIGIGINIEKTLNSIGIYTYQQITLWTPYNIYNISKKLNFANNRIEVEKWSQQANKLHKELFKSFPENLDKNANNHFIPLIIKKIFKNQTITLNSKYGIIFTSPHVINQNEKLHEQIISEEITKKLHQIGIYTYKQSIFWNDHNILHISKFINQHNIANTLKKYKNQSIKKLKSTDKKIITLP